MEISKFRIESQRITNVIFETNKKFKQNEKPLEYVFNTEVRIGKNKDINNKALVSLKFQVFNQEESEDIPYFLENIIEGIFSWEEDVFGEEEIDKLLSINAPAVLLSYIRTNTSLLTVAAGFDPLVIPLMNFTK